MKMKKQVATILAAALVLGAGAGTSYAYLTGQDQAENGFRASEVDVDIEETFDPVPEINPGTTIVKAPSVLSRSDIECYVRVMIRFSDSDAENFCEPLNINKGWSRGEDGYYYWDRKLKPGERTGTVFDRVKIRSDVPGEEVKPFEILVYAEAVQCQGQTMEEAWEVMKK